MVQFSNEKQERPRRSQGADSQPRARRARNHAPANRARAVLRGAFGRYVQLSTPAAKSRPTTLTRATLAPTRTYSYAIPHKNGCSRLVGDGPYLADSTGTTSRNAQNARPYAYIALLPIRTKLRNLFVRFFSIFSFHIFCFFENLLGLLTYA